MTSPDRASDAPIIQLCHGLLVHGLKEGHTQIHLVPSATGEESIIRARRLDTWLEIMRCPQIMYPSLVRRFKVMAGLEPWKSLPEQTGTLHLQVAQADYEIRVTTRQTPGGEDEVILDLPRAAA